MLAIIPSARALAPDRSAQPCACFPLAPRPRPAPSSAPFPSPPGRSRAPDSPLSSRPNPAPFSAFILERNYFRPAPKNLQPTDSKNPLIWVPNLAHKGKILGAIPLEIGLRFPIPPYRPIFPFHFQWRETRALGFPDCARFLKCPRSFKPCRPAQFES
jgi:hypothetical protein